MSNVGTVFDKRGTPLEEFDILKVFLFVSALRREKRYMYKQVRKVVDNGQVWLVAHHLNDDFDGTWHNSYNIGGHLADTRIVQSTKCDHDERPRTPPQTAGQPKDKL